MKDYGLVSIITPSYNCAEFIKETIESIISQSYTNWELLITDDCSTDNSCDVIGNYVRKDPRIKLIRLQSNSGAGVARNTSIEEAKVGLLLFVTVMTGGILINLNVSWISWLKMDMV